MISFVSCRTGGRLSFLAASLEMKFLPDPVSKYAQNTSPLTLTGIIAGSVVSSVTVVYPVRTVPSPPSLFPLLHRLVWCLAPQW